jgi:hypothetical protein
MWSTLFFIVFLPKIATGLSASLTIMPVHCCDAQGEVFRSSRAADAASAGFCSSWLAALADQTNSAAIALPTQQRAAAHYKISRICARRAGRFYLRRLAPATKAE